MSEIIVPEQTISGFAGDNGLYVAQAEGAFNRIMPSREYEIVFDGTKYTCIAWLLKEETSSSVGICVGNGYLAAGTGEDTGEPFLVVVELTEDGEFQCAVGTTHSGDSHVISITKTDAVLREQEFDGFSFGSGVNAMELNYSVADLIAGENYNLKIDGIDYQCEAKAESSDGMDAVVLGNLGLLSEDDFENTGESFLIVNISPIASEIPLGATLIVAQADSEKTSYTIGISLAEEAKTGVDIVLYDRTGEPVTYEGIETITTDTPTSGKRATFTYGTLLSGVEIGLNLKNGDQKISVPEGSLVKEAVVKKPTTLIPENILAGVDIAGVVGTHKDDTVLTDMEIPLDMTEGDQKLSVPDGYVVKTAVIKKPETLIPENIKHGVNVAGIEGGYLGDSEEKTVELDFAEGDMTVIPSDGKLLEKVDIPKPVALVPENIKNGEVVAGITGTFGGEPTIKLPAAVVDSTATFPFSEITDTTFYPPTVQKIGWSAFASVSGLVSVAMSGVTEIGYSAFYNCQNLKVAHFPNASRILTGAFQYCYSLTDIDFSGAIEIGSSAFYSCANVSNFSFPNCEKLCELALYDTKGDVYIPNIKWVGNQALYGRTFSVFCSVSYYSDILVRTYGSIYSSWYKSSYWPLLSETRILGAECFTRCSTIYGVSNTQNIEYIGDSAFCSCYKMSTASFPKCKAVSNYAFAYCSFLSYVYLPECSEIGSRCFGNCTILYSIELPECETIGSSAFYSCGLKNIDAPKCKRIYWNAFQSCSIINADFPACTTIDAGAFSSCTKLTSAVFPEVTYIGDYAFCSCNALINTNFPKCSRIGSWAFSKCGISTISLPNCTFIGIGAFCSCTSLSSVYLLGSIIASMGSYSVLYNTNALISIYVRESLASTYKTMPFWSSMASKIVGMTDEEIATLDAEQEET